MVANLIQRPSKAASHSMDPGEVGFGGHGAGIFRLKNVRKDSRHIKEAKLTVERDKGPLFSVEEILKGQAIRRVDKQ